MAVQQKYARLSGILRELGPTVVAYSGGVDSTFLLKAAVDTLGADNVLACIGVSASLAASQYDQAKKNAQIIGARLREVHIDELADDNYAANNPDRCFHCKTHLYSALKDVAAAEGFKTIVCGANLDDQNDYRPGHRAAEIFGVRSPLAEAGLTKHDIRRLSRRMNLPTAEMPASPCLASRISYGLRVTEKRLRQIEQAEDFLRSLGLVEFRVRHHDTIARIELRPEDIQKLTTDTARSAVVAHLKSLGFTYVTIDLQGFRSGSLNEPLAGTDKSNRPRPTPDDPPSAEH